MENDISNPSKKAKPNKGAASKTVCRRSWTRNEEEVLINALKDIVALGMKMLDVMNEEAWDDYVKKDVDAKSLRNKSWPFYEDWLIIFGKDRATGEFAESAADAVENMDKEDEVGESVPLDSLGVGGMECSNSVTHHPTASSEKRKENKRARAADTLVEGLTNFADKLCHVMEKADNRMEFIGSRMGYAHD
ncbi:hypothetical protein Acr_04g0001590 [Actinidia rufa]|uniref:Myb-like domain-containing protein n=1 Tax=Actinidia rufa TaxID=165716 RepID=A0A7J0EG41_9ERIC|nr:hypothetical protein Acr_04g0001590 [Actinidia rufa]